MSGTDFYQVREPESAQRRIVRARDKVVEFLHRPSGAEIARPVHVQYTRTLSSSSGRFDEFSVRADVGAPLTDRRAIEERGWNLTTSGRNAFVTVPHATYDARVGECTQSPWPLLLAVLLFGLAGLLLLLQQTSPTQ